LSRIKYNLLIICENTASQLFTQLNMPKFEVRQTGKLNLTSIGRIASSTNADFRGQKAARRPWKDHRQTENPDCQADI
jgi:hypothetical protein